MESSESSPRPEPFPDDTTPRQTKARRLSGEALPVESLDDEGDDGALWEGLSLPESCSHVTLAPSFEPIPPDLHSVYEDGPFTKCTVCSSRLQESGLYEIQKVYRGSEVVFETALCHGCGEDLVKELSNESLEAMKGFLLCNFRPTREADHCHFCGFPRPLFSNYTIVGACQGSSLIVPRIVMCEKCSENLNERLSKKTRDVQADFIHNNFPGVPADLDLSPSFGGLF